MSFSDKVFILEEHGIALLLRLEEFKHAFTCSPIRPISYHNLVAAKCWPLTQFNGIDADPIKISNSEKAQISKEQVIQEFEPFSLLLADFVDVRNALCGILQEYEARYSTFKVDELKKGFIRIFNLHVRLHLVLASFQTLKLLCGTNMSLFSIVNHSSHPLSEPVLSFLRDFTFHDPIGFLQRDLKNLTKLVESSMSITDEMISALLDPEQLMWVGALGTYDGDELHSTIKQSWNQKLASRKRSIRRANKEASNSNNDSSAGNECAQSTDTTERSEAEDDEESEDDISDSEMEVISETPLLHMQMAGEGLFFAVFGYLICPDILQQTSQLDQVEAILSTFVAVPVTHDDCFLIHQPFEQLLSNIKRKGLKINKAMPQRALEVALQSAAQKAMTRQMLLVATGTRLFRFVMEDPTLLSTLCVEGCLSVLSFAVTEISIFCAHQNKLLQKKGLKLKEPSGDECSQIARVVELIVKMNDLLVTESQNISFTSRRILASRETKALSFVLSDMGKSFDSATLAVLQSCHRIISRATSDGILDPVAAVADGQEKRWNALELCWLDTQRVMHDITTTASKQRSSMHQTFWPIVTRIMRLLVCSSPTLFTRNLNKIGIGLAFRNNLHHFVRVLFQCSDSRLAEADTTASFVVLPSLVFPVRTHLHTHSSRAFNDEMALRWTQLFVMLLVRKVDQLLHLILVETMLREKETSWLPSLVSELVAFEDDRAMGKQQGSSAALGGGGSGGNGGMGAGGGSGSGTQSGLRATSVAEQPTGPGSESAFSQRDRLDRLAVAQHSLTVVLSALLKLSGEPGESTSMASFAISGVGDPDGFIRVRRLHTLKEPPPAINVTAMLSVMLRRFISRLFVHLALSSIETFPPTSSTHLRTLLEDCPDIPFIPHNVPFAIAASNMPQQCTTPVSPSSTPSPFSATPTLSSSQTLTSTTPTSTAIAATSAITTSQSESNSPSSRSHSPSRTFTTSASPLLPPSSLSHLKDDSLFANIDYESDRSANWWPFSSGLSIDSLPRPYSISSSLLSTPPSAATATQHPSSASSFQIPPDADWPNPPSKVLASITSAICIVKRALHAAYPLLQVDEIAQRVMLNLCVVPQMSPPSFCLAPNSPLGAWFYRLFGSEACPWSSDGSDQLTVLAPPPFAVSSASSASQCSQLLEGDGPAMGSLAVLYGRWFTAVLCVGILGSPEQQTFFSCQEGGFVRPPCPTPAIPRVQQQIVFRASASELRAAAELLGPFGVECVCEMIEKYALPRFVERIILWIHTHTAQLMSIAGIRGEHFASVIEETARQLKTKDATEFVSALVAIGASCHLIEVLKRNLSAVFTAHAPLVADTLRAIASTFTSPSPKCTLTEAIRLYSLVSPSSEGLPPIACSTPDVLSDISPLDSSFFAFVHFPSEALRPHPHISLLFPFAVLLALSVPAVWLSSTYIPNADAFNSNIHCAARGIVYAAYALGPRKQQTTQARDPLSNAPSSSSSSFSPVRGEQEREEEENGVLSLLSDPTTPQSQLVVAFQMLSRVTLLGAWEDEKKSAMLENKVIFLEKLFDDMQWMGRDTYERLLPQFLVKMAKSANWRLDSKR